ncbi:hypothetical protein D3C85_1639330 [compost metagenome]
MTDKVIQLFPHKQVEPDKLSNQDLTEFLNILDASLETFFELSPHEKFSLYKTLVEFTHTSLALIQIKEEK